MKPVTKYAGAPGKFGDEVEGGTVWDTVQRIVGQYSKGGEVTELPGNIQEFLKVFSVLKTR